MTTLAHRLRRHAAERPNDLAFRFVARPGRQPVEVTWGGLWSDATATAARFNVGPGSRIGIACESPRDFVVGLAACIVSGNVAIPLPTTLSRRSAPRTEAVLRAASPAAVLTGSDASTEAWLGELLSGTQATPVARDAPPGAEPAVAGLDDLDAFTLIQFTSGSTGRPRGVALSRGNLVANCAAIAAAYGLSAATRGLSWLPLHHDMGLVGHVLTPMWLGCRSTLIDPLRFLQRPLSWLKMAGPEQATITSAPNFAYEMCARAAETEGLDDIDLSSLTTLVCGGEPVLPATVRRFIAKFTPAGLSPAAFAPSYGLAEATLLVASGRNAHGPAFAPLPPATETGAPANTREVADLGPIVSGVDVRIVDDAGAALHDGSVGEIEISGPCIGRLMGADGTVAPAAPIRTGDLGVLNEGHLRVTGRRKGLIILRGQNVYPNDVEEAAMDADDAIAPGGVAAVGIDEDGTQKLVLMVEIDRKQALRAGMLPGLRRTVSQTVSSRVGHVPSEVIVLKYGTLPRTSSGKVRRGDAAVMYASGGLAGAILAEPASRQTDLVDAGD